MKSYKYFKISLFLIGFLFCYGLHNIQAQYNTNLDLMINCVTSIETKFIDTVEQNGKIYEIWLKSKDSKKEKPSYIYKRGSGFFVDYHEALILVTAKHIALKTNQNTTLTVARKNDNTPFKVKLVDFTQSGNLNWEHNDSADVSAIILNQFIQFSNSTPFIQTFSKFHFININTPPIEIIDYIS